MLAVCCAGLGPRTFIYGHDASCCQSGHLLGCLLIRHYISVSVFMCLCTQSLLYQCPLLFCSLGLDWRLDSFLHNPRLSTSRCCLYGGAICSVLHHVLIQCPYSCSGLAAGMSYCLMPICHMCSHDLAALSVLVSGSGISGICYRHAAAGMCAQGISMVALLTNMNRCLLEQQLHMDCSRQGCTVWLYGGRQR